MRFSGPLNGAEFLWKSVAPEDQGRCLLGLLMLPWWHTGGSGSGVFQLVSLVPLGHPFGIAFAPALGLYQPLRL